MTLIDTIEVVRDELIRRKLCTTYKNFSHDWLLRSHNNYCQQVRTNGTTPLAASAILHFALLERHQPDLAADIYVAMREEAQRQRQETGA
jgi:hypothetical protein